MENNNCYWPFLSYPVILNVFILPAFLPGTTGNLKRWGCGIRPTVSLYFLFPADNVKTGHDVATAHASYF